jgi:rhodanese-related sulfurtransferase
MRQNIYQSINLIISLMLLTIPISTQADDTEKAEKIETEQVEKKGKKGAKGNVVKITADLPYLDVQHEGKTVRIERNQDTSNKLTNSFSKTSRKCPPFCINPIELEGDIQTVGELEILRFLDKQVKDNKGLLIDARMPAFYDKGTIPGSVNIPFTVLTKGLDSKHTVKILKLLGATEKEGKWDFSKVRELALFCNGLWCGQSPAAIKNLVKLGYPAEKLFWYRGGMQAWQLLGLTTVTP